ncbi:MAG: dihydrodipicolinate synthase family protein [Clostridia bacterium]|nr:dihydrodipicolinate synthase family protein [Clostridia bacterium]
MQEGFYTALGTPLDKEGNLVESSLKKHVVDQIDAGAAGLLVMGSMGIEAYIKSSEHPKVAKAAVEAADGRCPVLIGVMDNSISRVKEKIDGLKGLKIQGVVATTPFYNAATQQEIYNFFTQIADYSPYPLYLYDLPVVTKTKINADTAERLMTNENIEGIKTGDLLTAKILTKSPHKRDDFSVIYSGLDLFDVAYNYGIKRNLDGMFSCTHPIANVMYKKLDAGDIKGASKELDKILKLRNKFVQIGVFNGFSYAMNILGYEGIFAPDYVYEYDVKKFEQVKECMKECGLL